MTRSFKNYLDKRAAEQAAREKAFLNEFDAFRKQMNYFAADAKICREVIDNFFVEYIEIVNSYIDWKVDVECFSERSNLITELGSIKTKIPDNASEDFRNYFAEIYDAFEEYGAHNFVRWYLDDTIVYDENDPRALSDYIDFFEALIILFNECSLESERVSSDGPDRHIVKEYV